MNVYEKYEAVIGLECHIQLLTQSKMYSSDAASYGEIPNSNVSVITLGHPGSLPVVNSKAIEFAVRLGIAVGADIREENQFARKNYFYADLPKGYQITQDKTPICNSGYISAKLKDGKEFKINLTRIHLEEDAGKSLHDIDSENTLVDLNRAGTPLLEIVTEPDFRTGEEAYAYLHEVRKLVRYLDICDGNMEEGSLRCDANISVRLKGVEKFGKKVEVKNMNSFRNVQRAIDFEIKRQIDLIEKGENIAVETRSYDAVNDITFSLRSKESANDYRYFPEPDLQPVFVTNQYIEEVNRNLPVLPGQLFKTFTKEYKLSDYDAYQLTETKEVAVYFNELILKTKNYKSAANWILGPVKSFIPVFVTNQYIEEVNRNLPVLPGQLFKTFTKEYKLSDYDAYQLTETKEVAVYFNELILKTKNYKSAANWILGPVKSFINERAIHFSEFKLAPDKVSEIIALIDEGKISNTSAMQIVFPELILHPEKMAEQIAVEKDLIQNSNSIELQKLIDETLLRFPDKVEAYKNGKVGLMGLFIGEVMKASKGKADPKMLSELMQKSLN